MITTTSNSTYLKNLKLVVHSQPTRQVGKQTISSTRLNYKMRKFFIEKDAIEKCKALVKRMQHLMKYLMQQCCTRLPPMLHDVAWPCNMLQHRCNNMAMQHVATSMQQHFAFSTPNRTPSRKIECETAATQRLILLVSMLKKNFFGSHNECCL